MILQKIKQFVKDRDWRSWSKGKMKVRTFIDHYQSDIILVIGVILISFLSFAMGYIVAKTQEKEPIRIEYESSHHWSGNLRIISGLEIG